MFIFSFYLIFGPNLLFSVQLYLSHCSLLNVAQKHNQANKIVISMGFLLPEHVVPVQQEQYGITK